MMEEKFSMAIKEQSKEDEASENGVGEPNGEEVVNAVSLRVILASIEDQQEEQAHVRLMLEGMRVRSSDSTETIIDAIQTLWSPVKRQSKKKEARKTTKTDKEQMENQQAQAPDYMKWKEN
ncbi:hypothetical protein AMTRI_Chr13g120880 [Amborella trichopoda]